MRRIVITLDTIDNKGKVLINTCWSAGTKQEAYKMAKEWYQVNRSGRIMGYTGQIAPKIDFASGYGNI